MASQAEVLKSLGWSNEKQNTFFMKLSPAQQKEILGQQGWSPEKIDAFYNKLEPWKEGMGSKAKRVVGAYAEPVLEAAGAATGAALAIPVNLVAPGVAEVAGGTLGYLAGKEAARGIKQVMGIEKPTTLAQEVGLTARSVPEAGIQAAAGPLLGGTMQAGAKTALAEKGLLGKGIEKVAGATGKLLQAGLGAATKTGEHGSAIGEAFKNTPGFKDALSGKIRPEAVVDNARDALRTIRDKRAVAYVEKYEKFNPNAQIDIAPLEKRFEQFMNERGIKTDESGRMLLRTSGIAKEGQKELQEADSLIGDFLREHGVTTETKKGIITTLPFKYADLLKRALSDLKPKSNEARAIINSIRDTVRTELNKLPHYQEMTKDYAMASNVIEDIEKSLSITGKKTDDQILRRLMQAMKEDTTLKRDLMEELTLTGGKDITGQVAGITMRPWIKEDRIGLAAGEAAAAIIAGHPMYALVMAGSSPRLVGEAAYYMGLSSKYLKQARLSGASYRYLGMEIQRLLKKYAEESEKQPQSDIVSKPTVEARAEGGPVMANKPYLVGEKGPEVIVPKQDGTVIPNKNIQPTNGHDKIFDYVNKAKTPETNMPTEKVVNGIKDYLNTPFVEQGLSQVGKAAKQIYIKALDQIQGLPYQKAEDFLKAVNKKFGNFLQADPLLKKIISDFEDAFEKSATYKVAANVSETKETKKEPVDTDRRKGETLKEWNQRLRDLLGSREEAGPVGEYTTGKKYKEQIKEQTGE